MKLKNAHIAVLATLVVLSTSCVSMKKYKELEKKQNQCAEENQKLKSDNQRLSTLSNEQASELQRTRKQVAELKDDTTNLGQKRRQMHYEFSELKATYDQLNKQYNDLIAGNKQETKKILAELQETQEKLLKKEDDLKRLEAELKGKKSSLDQLQAALAEKEARMNELQNILNRKDSVVKALRNKVAEALLGYENNGLTIVNKNGKVYVSMEDKLLFASGSYTVEPKGLDALKKLAKVLETNPDINVMVEGHTDNVPYNGQGQLKDNWDLSAMRATAVVKILLANSKIDPKRLTAAGRSEYLPVDPANTKEAKAKNRRTEIILTPKLDELFKIIETN